MRASYFLKHKDVCVAQVVFDTQTGNMAECSKLYEQNCLPVFCAGIQERLKQWWQDRAVPKNQSNIQALLRENDIASTQSFLLNNLGLSLIDVYWVCPVNLDVSWKQVSLFQNMYSKR